MPPQKKTPTAQEQARARFEYMRSHPTNDYGTRGGQPGGGSGTNTQGSQPAKNMPGPPEDADGWLSGIFNKIRKNMGG